MTSVLVLVGAGCNGTLAGASQGSAGETFWSTLRLNGDEVESYASVQEMAKHADAVVLGTFASFALNRTIQGDVTGDLVGYGGATIQVEKLLAGALQSDALVEFLLPTRTPETTIDVLRRQVGDLAIQLPKARMVLFLREKVGPGEQGLYRLVNSSGLWIEANGNLTAPLYQPIGDGKGPYASELSGIASIDALVELLLGATVPVTPTSS